MGVEQEPARRMVVVTKPERSEVGYEDVVTSGTEIVRRKSEGENGTGRNTRQGVPVSTGSEEKDLASDISSEFLPCFFEIKNTKN